MHLALVPVANGMKYRHVLVTGHNLLLLLSFFKIRTAFNTINNFGQTKLDSIVDNIFKIKSKH